MQKLKDQEEEKSYYILGNFKTRREEKKPSESESSSEDNLPEVFGIDKSLTKTPKIRSQNMSESVTDEDSKLNQRVLQIFDEEDEDKPAKTSKHDLKTKFMSLCSSRKIQNQKTLSHYSTTESNFKMLPGKKEVLDSLIEENYEEKFSSSSSPSSRRGSASPPVPKSRKLLSKLAPGHAPLATEPGFYPSGGPEWPKASNRKSCRVNSKEFAIDPAKISKRSLTTLQIANIPNKYTKPMMMSYIDEYFHDKYDFFYLPIDFKNKCNIGYAFINFMDLESVTSFFTLFNGRKWPKFQSDKICEVRYAKLQGKQQCIDHFENSCLIRQNDESLKPFIRNSPPVFPKKN